MTREAIVSKFLARAEVKSSGCWEWQGERSRRVRGFEYGLVRLRQRRVMAHRYAYELFVAPIPDGLFVLHSCDNPPCVNPEHLRPGTAQENADDMRLRRRAHYADVAACAKGHEFTPENTYFSSQRGLTRRHCRICRKAAWRKNQNYTGQGRWPLRIV